VSDELEALLNVGPVGAERLRAVGISTPAELEEVGAVEAYRRLDEAFPRNTSLNALYALHGALLGVRWDHLPPEVRQELRAAAAR
jgi:DNA transformation protein